MRFDFVEKKYFLELELEFVLGRIKQALEKKMMSSGLFKNLIDANP
jgi:hypothetical protein